MINTTAGQFAAVLTDLRLPGRLEMERVWTHLVADILDKAEDQVPFVNILCGKTATFSGRRFDPWIEAQPLSPRLGTPKVDHETNSKIDLAFGAIARRGTSSNGIEFDPNWPDSWACFVEAKFFSDCDCQITNNPYRNQLERDIESLLCFQVNGQFPERLFFTMLTPRKFKEKPRSRMYGYRINEYLRDSCLLVEDIASFPTPGRNNYGQLYPDVAERVGVLTITWATFEDIIEAAFGQHGVDTMDPTGIADLEDRLTAIAAGLAGM